MGKPLFFCILTLAVGGGLFLITSMRPPETLTQKSAAETASLGSAFREVIQASKGDLSREPATTAAFVAPDLGHEPFSTHDELAGLVDQWEKLAPGESQRRAEIVSTLRQHEDSEPELLNQAALRQLSPERLKDLKESPDWMRSYIGTLSDLYLETVPDPNEALEQFIRFSHDYPGAFPKGVLFERYMEHFPENRDVLARRLDENSMDGQATKNLYHEDHPPVSDATQPEKGVNP